MVSVADAITATTAVYGQSYYSSAAVATDAVADASSLSVLSTV